jgi:endonuclease/exonuclease/phosphatase family metal-dependent hydrolase
MDLTIATYNIHKGVTALRRRPRIHDVRLAVHSLDADILFLQEVQDRNERLASHRHYHAGTQLDFLATAGYEHRAYGMNAVYPHGHHGNAILSRLAIRHFENLDISDHALEKRGLLHAVARIEGAGHKPRELHLICVHLGLIQRSRARQASFLADFIDAELPARAPLVIAGDFNDWQRRVDGALRARLGVTEVGDALADRRWYERLIPSAVRNSPLVPSSLARNSRAPARPPKPARTFPSFAPWLHLDRIYLRGCDVMSVYVPRGREWARRSDHMPLVAHIKVR